MGHFFLKLPKMGESVAEATVTKWLKEIGETVEMDDSIVEIATDKVDTDVPCEVEGILIEKRFEENQVVAVGEVLAVIETQQDIPDQHVDAAPILEKKPEPAPAETAPQPASIIEEVEPATAQIANDIIEHITTVKATTLAPVNSSDRFYSPLVKNIAQKEGVTAAELDAIPGTGKDQRLTKNDLLAYLQQRGQAPEPATPKAAPIQNSNRSESAPAITAVKETTAARTDQWVEMSRMEKLIAGHMKSSLEVSAHVQSFIEADVTEIWDWREKVKTDFQKRTGEKLTFTPLFMHAIIQALHDFPQLNSSIEGDQIHLKKEINLGMATALPDGNLIVPVIKNADHLNIIGLAKAVNDLAARARTNSLLPDEVQNGTYTMTNIGNFGSIMGTPIINQPQVGIIAIGAIRKLPSVIETPEGDFIGIRKKVILSHSYDHRIINGATGGLFVKRVAENLENWAVKLPY